MLCGAVGDSISHIVITICKVWAKTVSLTPFMN
jgi:hypothetical protein